jgi:hypothetical protein
VRAHAWAAQCVRLQPPRWQCRHNCQRAAYSPPYPARSRHPTLPAASPCPHLPIRVGVICTILYVWCTEPKVVPPDPSQLPTNPMSMFAGPMAPAGLPVGPPPTAPLTAQPPAVFDMQQLFAAIPTVPYGAPPAPLVGQGWISTPAPNGQYNRGPAHTTTSGGYRQQAPQRYYNQSMPSHELFVPLQVGEPCCAATVECAGHPPSAPARVPALGHRQRAATNAAQMSCECVFIGSACVHK